MTHLIDTGHTYVPGERKGMIVIFRAVVRRRLAEWARAREERAVDVARAKRGGRALPGSSATAPLPLPVA